ncbi:hypothetical protein LPJ66_009557 [Kickxella alabastrina]|uniref:Uncharacterized protein n=1 Tax=Kickxella alabastrina TaxID=61397 RepID=A0ACC1I5G2_9FUNG|nr:hypothetical protein LPJ66_009557 [Kickxella alabastrina]
MDMGMVRDITNEATADPLAAAECPTIIEADLPEALMHEPAVPATARFNFPMRGSPQMLTAPGGAQGRAKKVALKPGFSPLDWARLVKSGENLSGVPVPRPYTMDEIKLHNKRDDCWMVIGNKIYNVTRYMDFHPGGKSQLMRAAGKDGTKLFYESHAWVNPDNILGPCLVGFVAGPGGF